MMGEFFFFFLLIFIFYVLLLVDGKLKPFCLEPSYS